MLDEKEIITRLICKYSIRKYSILRRTKHKVIYILENDNSKYVLKIYIIKSKRDEFERIFLSHVNRSELQNIYFPKIIDYGPYYILIEYIIREYYTRDSICERQWTDSDIKLWVAGLTEFQKISISPQLFSFKNRMIGSVYPVFKSLLLSPNCFETLNLRSILQIWMLTASYFHSLFFFRKILTHYDLQTYNYTFMKNDRKMSLIDFEIPYYLGDPLYDILYFITIPIKKITDWTFQGRLLREYLRINHKARYYPKIIKNRIRLILLLCNLQRMINFRGKLDYQEKYHKNIELLLNNNTFERWISSYVSQESN